MCHRFTITRYLFWAALCLSPFLPTSFAQSESESAITLIPEMRSEKVKIVDQNGNTIHSWPVDADRARLLPNCNLLVIHGSKWGLGRPKWRQLRNTVRQYNFDGEVVWEYRSADVLHHDVSRLDDGTTLLIRRTIVPKEWQLRVEDPFRRLLPIRSDTIFSINESGKPLWEWHAHENLDLNRIGSNNGWSKTTVAGEGKFKMVDWTHINTARLLPDNKMYDGGDNRFKPGNLLIQLRNWSTTLIVDSKSGQVVWEYKGDFQGGVSGGHDPQMIPKGYVGAGNILLLDNGRTTHNNRSIVLEIDPQKNNEVVWHYRSDDFYTPAAGSVQRLKNGNTLISEDRKGRVFEVDRDGKIVWQYLSDFEINRAERYSSEICPQLLKEGKLVVADSNHADWISSILEKASKLL